MSLVHPPLPTTRSGPRVDVARARARAALDDERIVFAGDATPTRWLCVGDPQVAFDHFAATLDHHGLLGDDGTLAPGVGLVSMGDHFDYGAGKHDDPEGHAARGLEGQLILAWLSAHPPTRVRILLGNHDAARVMELADFDDARFRSVRSALAVADDARRRHLVDEHKLPNPTMPLHDFCTWSEAQRAQVQRLLLAHRFDLALHARHDDRPLLLTHSALTTRELARLGLGDDDASAAVVAETLQQLLRTAVAAVADDWRAGRPTRLSLAPVHDAADVGEEAGGFLAHRPANPATSKDPTWEWNPARPRRFDPNTLPRGFDQACGHTGPGGLTRALQPWLVDGVGDAGRLHTLVVTADPPRVHPGIAAATDGVRLLLLDVALGKAAPDRVELLTVEAPG
jgi:hypothetical protein